MEMSSSEPISLRRPSRKIAWSSARRTRICCFVLAMSTERNLDGETRSMARIGLDGQHAPHGTRSLLDGDRSQPQTIQFVSGKPARKTKSLAVVVYYEY